MQFWFAVHLVRVSFRFPETEAGTLVRLTFGRTFYTRADDEFLELQSQKTLVQIFTLRPGNNSAPRHRRGPKLGFLPRPAAAAAGPAAVQPAPSDVDRPRRLVSRI